MKKTFGQKIRDYRVEHTHLSLRKLAEMAGISPTYLSRIENDKEPPPSEDIIIRIASALDVDKDQLLSSADKISPDLLKTIREKPGFFPNFIRTVRDFDETSLEDILKLVQLIQSKSLRMKRKEWQYVEKIIRDLLGEKVSKEELQTIYEYVHTEITAPK